MDILVHTYLTPRVVEVLDPTTSVTVQEIVNAVRDWEDDNLSFDQLISAAGKEALGGGVTVGITATLLNAQLMFTGRTTALESGTCTTADPEGKTLHASAGSFVVNGVYRGCTIDNYTTGGLAVISAIISNIELTSAQLSGGSRDTWEVGDNFRVLPNVQCSIEGGNLVAVDAAGAELSPVVPSPNTQVIRSSSSSATLQELSAIQYASFGGGVTVDVLNGVAGTAFPIGTIEMSVDNIIDAVSIANSRGFNILFIKGDITLSDVVSLANFTVKGESIVKSHIAIDSTALVTGTEFVDATISGTLDGMNTTYHCAIQDLSYVQGHIRDCVLEEYTMTLAGGEETVFLNCWSAGARQDKIPTIDMGGSGKALAVRGHSGGIKIVNKTGPDDAVLEFESGRIIIDSTVTAGKVVVRGVGQIVDNSTGTADVNTDGLMSKGTISSAVWDESMSEHLLPGSSGESLGIDQFNNFVTINAAGVAGTAFPIGTEAHPVNNIADADTIATSMGINRFHFMSDYTFDNTVNIANYNLYGQGRNSTTFTFESGCIVAYCATYNAKITGLSLGLTYMNNCLIFDYGGSGLAPSDKTVVAENCIVSGVMAVPSNYTGVLKVLSCYTGIDAAGLSSAIVDADGANFKLVLKGHSGDVKIINSTHVDSYYSLDFESGGIELDLSVTAGDFVIRGVGLLTDNSTGVSSLATDGLVNKNTVANAVWDELTFSHLIDGSAGSKLDRILAATEVKQAAVNDLSASSTKFMTTLTETNNFWDRGSLLFTSGANTGQIRAIKHYASTSEITIQTPLNTAPADGDAFIIICARKFLTPDIIELADQVKVTMEAAGTKLTDVHDEAFGRWSLDPIAQTLTYYKADDTVLKIFDLTSTGAVVPAFIGRTPQ